MRAVRVIGFTIIVILALAVGFAGGLVSNQFASLLPVTGLLGRDATPAPTPQPGKLDENLIQEAYRIIQQHYADRSTLQTTNLTYGALTGMVDALGDTGHSRF